MACASSCSDPVDQLSIIGRDADIGVKQRETAIGADRELLPSLRSIAYAPWRPSAAPVDT